MTPERPLTRPLTLFGLVVGLCAALHWVTLTLESCLGALLLIAVITGSFHVLGRWLTRSIDGWKFKTVLVGALSSSLFLGVCGTIAEFTSAHHSSSFLGTLIALGLVGAFLGLVMALPFLVPLTLVMRAARRVGRARPYSVIDGSDRRMLWLAWAGALLLWNALSLWWKARYGAYSAGFLVAFFIYWLAHNRIDLARLRAFSVAGQRPRAKDAGPIDPRDRRLTDYGIGDEEWEQWTSPFAQDNPYREGPELRRVIRGSRELAEAALKEVRWLAVLGLVLSLACLGAHLYQQLR